MKETHLWLKQSGKWKGHRIALTLSPSSEEAYGSWHHQGQVASWIHSRDFSRMTHN